MVYVHYSSVIVEPETRFANLLAERQYLAVARTTWSPMRLAHSGERLISSDPISGYFVEEMRSLEVEREHDVGTERRERLRRRDAGGDVVPAGMRVNKGLVAEG